MNEKFGAAFCYKVIYAFEISPQRIKVSSKWATLRFY